MTREGYKSDKNPPVNEHMQIANYHVEVIQAVKVKMSYDSGRS